MRAIEIFWNAIQQRLTTKLVAAFTLMALLLLVVLGVTVDARTSGALEDQIRDELTTLAVIEGREVGALLEEEVLILSATVSTDNRLLEVLEEANQAYTGRDVVDIEQELITQDAEWRAAADSTTPLIEATLNNASAEKLRTFISLFPNYAELILTDRYGATLAATGRTSDFYQADEDWWQAGWNEGDGAIFLSSPIFDESAGVVALEVTIPVSNPQTGEVLGVLKGVFRNESLVAGINDFEFGNTGSAQLFDGNGHYIAATNRDLIGEVALDETLLDGRILSGTGSELNAVNRQRESVVVGYAPVTTDGTQPVIDNLGWAVRIEQSRGEAFSLISDERTALIVLTVIFVVIFGLFTFVLGRSLTRNVSKLAVVSRQLGAGDFSARADIRSRDEIGQLSTSFNNMANLIQERDTELAERLADLQTAFAVGEQISTIFNLDRLLQDVTDLTKERFRLYHSHIYIYEHDLERLLLTAGAGHVGRQMVAEERSIQIDNRESIVAQAARTREYVAINDVTSSPTFLPHRLLPMTRAELAVPLVARGQLLGVLDVQADEIGYFDDDSIGLMRLMGGQIATAISNANLFSVAQQASQFEQALGRFDRYLLEAIDIDEIVETAARELGVALRVSRSAVELALPHDAESNPADAQDAKHHNGNGTKELAASDDVQTEAGLD